MDLRAEQRKALGYFGLGVLLLVALFNRALIDMVKLALANDLYSHAILIPLISVYLARTKDAELKQIEFRRDPALGLGLLVLAVIPWFVYAVATQGGVLSLATEDSLFLRISSFVSCVLAVAGFLFGRDTMRLLLLPCAMLFFIAPLPKAAESGIEVFFQHTSATVSAFLFYLSNTPVLNKDLVFYLPQITLEVGRECSGIRSSLVLFITSIVASYLFLQTPWKRTVLVLAIIPLAILRNGFRIFIIGLLCVHVDPAMIDSWVHRRGGPMFFAISLVPLFALLLILRRSEASKPVAPVESSRAVAVMDKGATS